MTIKSVDVARLSTAQVKALLALGEKRPPLPAAGDEHAPLGQLLGDLDQDDMELLLADLQSPVLVADAGPISFVRLTGISAQESEQFQGKTFLKMLTSSRTSRAALEHLAEFGQLLAAPALPRSTRLAGAAVRAIARLALHTRFNIQLEKNEAQTTAAIVQSLASTRAAKPLRELAERSSATP